MQTPETNHQQWELIADLPDAWHDYCREDLRAVRERWDEEKSLLKDPEKIDQFQERLMRLWAIETGIIERLYTIDRGVTVAIVDVGLDALARLHGVNRPGNVGGSNP